jgi:hypothetical protein
VAEPIVTDELIAEVTARINETLHQLNRLPPKARDAAVMTTILALAEKLLKHGAVKDPHFNFLMLMSGLTDIYHGVYGPPNRTLQ